MCNNRYGGFDSPTNNFEKTEVKPIVQSNGNGSQENPEIEKVFEPLDDETQAVQDRWVEIDKLTGDYKITFSLEMREELGIESDSELESD